MVPDVDHTERPEGGSPAEVRRYVLIGLVCLAGAPLAAWLLFAMDQADTVIRPLGRILFAAILVLPVIGVVQLAIGWSLGRGPHRFVFVDEHVTVADERLLNSILRSSTPAALSHWVHLVDTETERAIGWVKVVPAEAEALVAVGVAVLHGSAWRRFGLGLRSAENSSTTIYWLQRRRPSGAVAA